MEKMARKDRKDSHRVITKTERKGRKQHEAESVLEGVRATSKKGREMDAAHNEKVEPAEVTEVAEITEQLAKAEREREEAESIPEYIEPEDDLTGSQLRTVKELENELQSEDADESEEAAPSEPESEEVVEVLEEEAVEEENHTVSPDEQIASLEAQIAALRGAEEAEE